MNSKLFKLYNHQLLTLVNDLKQVFFFPIGRYRSKTINLLTLEDPKDSYNVSFLGPMEFIGIGRTPVK
jgi:hypothetical protein